MPTLDGEDAWSDPAEFQATGYYGQTFSYDESSPSYIGNTSLLKDFDSYKISIYVDFAWTALTLVDDSIGIPGDFDYDGDVDGADFLSWQRGESPSSLSGEDLSNWQMYFGTIPSVSASQVVPEPSSVVLALAWAFVFLPVRAEYRRA
jgi:hypothetical protein